MAKGAIDTKETRESAAQPLQSLTISLAAVAVLTVALVAVIATVCPFLRWREQFSGLLLVFGDQWLSLLLHQLFIHHLI